MSGSIAPLASAYLVGPQAILMLVVAIVLGAVAYVVLVREHASRVAIAFFWLAVSACIWLLAFVGIYSATSEPAALWWSQRVENIGVAFIPTAMLAFAFEVSGTMERRRWVVVGFAAISLGFYLSSILTDWFVPAMYRYWWGFYPRYSFVGILYMGYFAILLAWSMLLFVRGYRRAITRIQRLRMRSLIVAFSIAYIGSVDFLAAYHVPVYPVGYLAVFGFLISLFLVVVRYRLVDINAASMGDEVMNSMIEGLLVLDPRGVIRLANRSACSLLRMEHSRLVGREISNIAGAEELSTRLPHILKAGAESFDITIPSEKGDLTYHVATSVMYGPLREPAAVVCVAGEITQRIHMEQEVERMLEQLLSLRTIDRAITGGLELGLTLDVVLDQAESQLKADASAIYLHNREAKVLEFAGGRGLPDDDALRSSERFMQSEVMDSAFDHAEIESGLLAEVAHWSPRFAKIQSFGFSSYHSLPLYAKGQLRGVIELYHRDSFRPGPRWAEFFTALAEQAAIAVDNGVLFQEMVRSNQELRLGYDRTLEAWALALELRDIETQGHSRRVSEMTVLLADKMGMSQEEITHVRRGALLHDIGKMGIPDSILFKRSGLTDDEWVTMRSHTQIAYDMLKRIPFLSPALDIPYCHHEKWDGTGYPRGLRGEAIPFAARLFSVVDVWDALRSPRSYRDAWPEDRVRDYIITLAGSHFDPAVVEQFVAMEWRLQESVE